MTEHLTVALLAEPAMQARIAVALGTDSHVVLPPATSVDDLGTLCADKHPHVVVGSWSALGPDGQVGIRRILGMLPRARVVVVFRKATSGGVQSALAAGADGVVVEAQMLLTLPIVVEAVASGQSTIPRDLRRSLQAPALSPRERQMLTGLVQGRSNGEIARELCLAESTVKSHVSSLYAKLGVQSRAEATAVAAGANRRSGNPDTAPRGDDPRVLNGGYA